MPTNQSPRFQTPHQKAVLGTAFVLLLLLIVGGTSYWYGTKNAGSEATDTNGKNAPTNTSAVNSNSSSQPLAATISKISESSLDLRVGSGDAARLVTANISSDTTFRKYDYRSTRTSSGAGVPIKMSDLQTGNAVVVVAQDTTGTVVEASKIFLFIYP